MKNEIKNLLASEKGTLKVNEFFYLQRWTEDALGDKVDALSLNMEDRLQRSRKIKSRDIQGITKEVSEAMAEMMNDCSEDMCKRWKGGLI